MGRQCWWAVRGSQSRLRRWSGAGCIASPPARQAAEAVLAACCLTKDAVPAHHGLAEAGGDGRQRPNLFIITQRRLIAGQTREELFDDTLNFPQKRTSNYHTCNTAIFTHSLHTLFSLHCLPSQKITNNTQQQNHNNYKRCPNHSWHKITHTHTHKELENKPEYHPGSPLEAPWSTLEARTSINQLSTIITTPSILTSHSFPLAATVIARRMELMSLNSVHVFPE